MAVILKCECTEEVELCVGISTVIHDPPYTGPYEYTPTRDTQTVEINGFRATSNITINPIPPQYGLITWNGSVLTVS